MALVWLLAAPEAEGAEVSLGASAAAEPNAEPTAEPNAEVGPWLHRYAPRRNMFHLGVFGGVLFPARDIELFEIDDTLADQGFKPYRAVAPEFGARIGYFPLDFLGLEAEGALGLGQVEGDERATLWAFRGHVIGQIPRWSVTPFVLAGAGVLGVRSGVGAVGDDADLAFHLGGGVAAHVTRSLTLRLEVRDVISPQQGATGGGTNSPEILLGIGWTRRPPRSEPRPAPPTAAVEPIRTPRSDEDWDGFFDDEDACPLEVGVAPDGCPDPDPDGDNVLGDADACPTEKGPEPDGCPAADTDGDGIDDGQDACPQEPETFNAFEDADGCPDAMPDDLGAFEGTLEGVNFQIDSARLRTTSRKNLDAVVAVLAKYSKVTVEISGHTDSTGSPEHNIELSKSRAESVKAYLVDHGVEGDRVETRGAGPDEPIDTNASVEGRAKNRRIEFRLLNCKCGG
ncbi:MAG: OmpA family protein [Nannocystales bacterium]